MKPILRNVPEIVETERLIIRVPRAGDGEVVMNAINESLEELKVFMLWAQEPQTLEYAEAHARQTYALFIQRESLNYYMFRKSDNVFVGGIGFPRLNWHVPSFEIGYWRRTSLSKHGYVTEAVHALTDMAFKTMNARRVELHCDADNEASANVARKTGFEFEGRLRNQGLKPDGRLRDMLIFSKIYTSPDTP